MLASTAALRVQVPKHSEGCLFCRRDDGGFTSREHVFSEALGNHEYIIDPGVVCDRCNNGPLSRADEALVNFPGITLLRAERGLRTKAGKPVVSKWGNATVAFSDRGTLDVYGPSKEAMRNMPEPGRMPPDGGKMELTTGGPVTANRIRSMVRSVWKSALELVYWDQGAEFAFDPVFDEAREGRSSAPRRRRAGPCYRRRRRCGSTSNSSTSYGSSEGARQFPSAWTSSGSSSTPTSFAATSPSRRSHHRGRRTCGSSEYVVTRR